jgi:hypothetical protein
MIYVGLLPIPKIVLKVIEEVVSIFSFSTSRNKDFKVLVCLLCFSKNCQFISSMALNFIFRLFQLNPKYHISNLQNCTFFQAVLTITFNEIDYKITHIASTILVLCRVSAIGIISSVALTILQQVGSLVSYSSYTFGFMIIIYTFLIYRSPIDNLSARLQELKQNIILDHLILSKSGNPINEYRIPDTIPK